MKWEKITYLGIATCTVLAIYNLSEDHPHYEEPPVSCIFIFLFSLRFFLEFIAVIFGFCRGFYYMHYDKHLNAVYLYAALPIFAHLQQGFPMRYVFTVK